MELNEETVLAALNDRACSNQLSGASACCWLVQ
jgi:hypothetical protein